VSSQFLCLLGNMVSGAAHNLAQNEGPSEVRVGVGRGRLLGFSRAPPLVHMHNRGAVGYNRTICPPLKYPKCERLNCGFDRSATCLLCEPFRRQVRCPAYRPLAGREDFAAQQVSQPHSMMQETRREPI
jgi:hypothetical protein